jgi:hypothetical protein
MKRWGVPLVAVAAIGVLVVVLSARNSTARAPAPATAVSSSLSVGAPEGRRPAASGSRVTPPPRFVPPEPTNRFAKRALESAESRREWAQKIADSMDQTGARMGLTAQEVEKLRHWRVIAGELILRAMTDPPVSSSEERGMRDQVVARISAAREKAELQLFGGDWGKWNRYNRISNAAADGRLARDEVDDDGAPRRRPPQPGDTSVAISIPGTPLWEQDSGAFDRLFE